MLQHVTREIPSSELDGCISFYRLLGFEQVPVPVGIGNRAVWLEREGTQIHLMPREGSSSPQDHIGLVVERYDATVAALREQGVEIDPRREHWGSPRAYVRDPAGNLVELMAWPPRTA